MSTPKVPLVIAHRGASGAAPENTMAAFRKAIEMGSDMIEIDIQRTRDGHLVVFHDRTLGRTSNGSGVLRDHTLDELRQLDAGSWFGEEFVGEPIPTLVEVLELVRGRCEINIEIKNLPYQDPEIEATLLKTLAETAFPLNETIISSFDHVSLARLSKLEPNIPTAALFGGLPASLAGMDTPILHPHWNGVTAGFMAMAKEAGRKVNVYTVDKPHLWGEMIEAGVDGIITNYPDQLRAYLAENGIIQS